MSVANFTAISQNTVYMQGYIIVVYQRVLFECSQFEEREYVLFMCTHSIMTWGHAVGTG